MTDTRLTWEPSEVSPPGDTLIELIDERSITQSELARRMGRTAPALARLRGDVHRPVKGGTVCIVAACNLFSGGGVENGACAPAGASFGLPGDEVSNELRHDVRKVGRMRARHSGLAGLQRLGRALIS